tara:strand:+ start:690 stop:992 length:303 start_codon:yes stop_codon:yes gene_type:complete
MRKKNHGREHTIWSALAVVLILIISLTGCVATKTSALKDHKEKVQLSIADRTYHIPKRPVDRHYIGYAWSKQFGPIDDPNAPQVRIKKEKSFNEVQQDFA